MINPEDVLAITSAGLSVSLCWNFGEHLRKVINPNSSLASDVVRDTAEIFLSCFLFAAMGEPVLEMQGLVGSIALGVLFGTSFGLPMHGAIDMMIAPARSSNIDF